MSRSYDAKKNKQQKHHKKFFEQYLFNAYEPRDHVSNNTPAELEAELLQNTFVMKRRFRHIAQRLRENY